MSGHDILKRARSQFRAARTVEALRKIDVPEWEAEVFYWPAMSVEESREIGRHIRVSESLTAGDFVDAAVTQVMLRARDAYGNRMFTDEDENALRDTDPDVLKRIAAEMGWGAPTSLEDAEKN